MAERTLLPLKQIHVRHDGGVILDFEYPLTPKFFLQCAQEDLLQKGARGLVNALTNAKRAIDCQTDTFLSALGFSPNNLAKQLGKDSVKSLQAFCTNQDQPLGFRVLESLGLVTTSLVARVRKIRHLLEHQYKKPTRKAVSDAIEIASLYVRACGGAMTTFLEDVSIGGPEVRHPIHSDIETFERDLSIAKSYSASSLRVQLYDWSQYEVAIIEVPPSDPLYLALLRVLFAVREKSGISDAIAFAVTSSGWPVEAKRFKVASITAG